MIFLGNSICLTKNYVWKPRGYRNSLLWKFLHVNSINVRFCQPMKETSFLLPAFLPLWKWKMLFFFLHVVWFSLTSHLTDIRKFEALEVAPTNLLRQVMARNMKNCLLQSTGHFPNTTELHGRDWESSELLFPELQFNDIVSFAPGMHEQLLYDWFKK